MSKNIVDWIKMIWWAQTHCEWSCYEPCVRNRSLFLSSTNFKYSIEWTGENLNSISNFRIARSIRLSEFVDSLPNYTSLSLSSVIWWSRHSGMKGISWGSQMLMVSCYDVKWLILWNNRFPTRSAGSRRLLPCSILNCFGWTSMWKAKDDRSINRQSQ